jgi:hypothetical protein
MSITRLIVALAVIAVLAIAVPYAAVRSLHQHRLASADADLQRLAPAVRQRIDTAPAVNVLLGPGRVPRTTDSRWHTGSTYPLPSALDGVAVTADPWGNGFVVNVGVRDTPSAVWLLSAGPDGTLQTPFDGSTTAPLGDDIGRRLR